MSQLSCLIIEDLEADAQVLMQMLSELPIAFKADWSQTSTDLLNRMRSTAYDLIFLDIRMPGLIGTDFLRDTPQRPPVIVVTAYLEYAADGYDLDIVDFLHKPYDRPRLQRSVNRVLNRASDLTLSRFRPINSIFLQTNRRLQQFHFNNILFIEAQGVYARIHGPHEVTTVSHSISSLEEQLPLSQFIRVQKSFIVNAYHITAVDTRSLWINTTRITVGAQYREPFKQFLGRMGGNNDRLLDFGDQ